MAVSMLLTRDAVLTTILHAHTLESAGQLSSLSAPLPQPHAPANNEHGTEILHLSVADQSAVMPAISASPVMATPPLVATMHTCKPHVIMLTKQQTQSVT